MVCLTDKSKSKKRGLAPLNDEDSDAKMVRPQFLESSSCDSTSTNMQEESLPWKSLPSDILERVLALLPLPEVFRLRCVCKRWNALMQCAQFQEWSLRCPVAWGPFYVPWVRWDARELRAVPWSSYDLAERKWIRMPQFEFPLLNQTSCWSLVTANGGLVCFRSADGQGVLVCNPLTKRWKELPSVRLDYSCAIISYMIVDNHRNSYKILFVGNATYGCSDSRYGTVDLYDSMTNAWSIGQNIPIHTSLICGAYCSGEFYSLIWQPHRGPYVVVRLDLTTLRWREEIIPIPMGISYCHFIVACLGRIYLVGAMYDRYIFKYASNVVFQLDQSNGWSKVSKDSNGHLLRFSRLIRGCGLNGSKIYLVPYPYHMWVAVYDCATSCWEEPIQIDVGAIFNKQVSFQIMFTFQPNLQVAP